MNKPTISDIFTPLQYSDPLEFNEFIKDRWDEIVEMLKDEKSYYFVAETFSGKTYSILDIAYKEKIKTILAVPLQIIAKQNSNKYYEKEEKEIYYLMAGDNNDETPWRRKVDWIMNRPDENKNVLLSVYNSLPKLFKSEKFKAKEYVLVIDECHNLVTQYNFRYKAINYLDEFKDKFKKVVYLTGTLEGTKVENHELILFKKKLAGDVKDLNLKINEFDERGSSKTLNNYYIVTIEKDGVYSLINHLVQNSNKLSLVLIDNILKLTRLRNALKNLYPEIKIAYLDAGTKNSSDYIFLEQSHNISEDIQIVLTTRVIADGANIHNKDVAIYFYNVKDPIVKRQFIGRVRQGVNNVYDFIGIKEEKSNTLNVKNIDFQHAEMLAVADGELQIANSYNHLNKAYNYGVTDNGNNGNKLLFQDSKQKYRISEYKIRMYILNQINDYIHKNLELLKEYFKRFYNIESEIVSYDSLLERQKLMYFINIKDFNANYYISKVTFEQSKDLFIEKLPDVLAYYKTLPNVKHLGEMPHNTIEAKDLNKDTEDELKRLVNKPIQYFIGHLHEFAKLYYPKVLLDYIIEIAKYDSYGNIEKLKLKLDSYFIYKLISGGVKSNEFKDIGKLNLLVEIIQEISDFTCNFEFNFNDITKMFTSREVEIEKLFFNLASFQNIVLASLFDFHKNSNKINNNSIRRFKGKAIDISLKNLLIEFGMNKEICDQIRKEENGILVAYRYLLTRKLPA